MKNQSGKTNRQKAALDELIRRKGIYNTVEDLLSRQREEIEKLFLDDNRMGIRFTTGYNDALRDALAVIGGGK